MSRITDYELRITPSYRWIGFLCEDSEDTMNRDRQILREMKNGNDSAVLRFYKWQNPTLSYGRLQKIDEETKKKHESEGWKIVQRPTGGGKVFHANDLCFSLFWKKGNESIPWGILDSYQSIHQWICDCLKHLCIEGITRQTSQDNDYRKSWCFQNPVFHDLLLNGKKIVGGAQWRDGNTALHQGSIQIDLSESHLPIFKSTFKLFFNIPSS